MPRTTAAATTHDRPAQKQRPAKNYNATRNRVTIQMPAKLDAAIHERLAAVRQVDATIDYSTLVRHLIKIGLGELGA
jgi:hypothetical protein